MTSIIRRCLLSLALMGFAATARADDPPVKFLTRDGVKLAYIEAGAGEPAILLVHGMTGNHSGMMPLFEHVSKTHHVVAVDLRGHGQSDAPKSDYTDAMFGDDLMFICNQRGLKNPVGIGHSFGGSTLLHLAVNKPDFLGGLVLLDSGVRSAESKAAELKPVYDDPNPNALREFLANRMYSPYDPPELREKNRTKQQPPSHVLEAMEKTVLAFNAADAAAQVKLPALFILSSRPFTDPVTLGRLGPNWQVGQVVASGHSVQLVVPEQTNAMVDRFLEIRTKLDRRGQ